MLYVTNCNHVQKASIDGQTCAILKKALLTADADTKQATATLCLCLPVCDHEPWTHPLGRTKVSLMC